MYIFKKSNPDKYNKVPEINKKLIKKLNNKFDIKDISDSSFSMNIYEFGNAAGDDVIIFPDENVSIPMIIKQFEVLAKIYRLHILDLQSVKCYDYDKNIYTWIYENIVQSLCFVKPICIGQSYGAVHLSKLMSLYPDKIAKVILISPYGIVRSKNIKFLLTYYYYMFLYYITKKDINFIKAINNLIGDKSLLDSDILEILKARCNKDSIIRSFYWISDKVEASMFIDPILIITGDKDVLFNSNMIKKASSDTFLNSTCVVLKNCPHCTFLSNDISLRINCTILSFLKTAESGKHIKSYSSIQA